MNLMPLVDRLEADPNLTLVPGEDLFLMTYPAETTLGLLMRPSLVGAQISHELPGYLKFPFQAIVRSRNYASGEELAAAVHKALTIRERTTVGEWTVNYIRPRSVPVAFPISAGEIIEFNTTFDACIVDPKWA